MRQVYTDAPRLEAINNTYKDLSLADYIEHIKSRHIDGSPDCLDPVIEKAVKDYAETLIGKKDTESCLQVLRKTRLIHTANHHIINFHPMTVQGNLLYEYLISLCTDSDVTPVFSCNTINMSNAFYPRGILIYDTSDGHECPIPVFPYKYRKVAVSHAPSFTSDMVSRAAQTIRRHKASGRISSSAADSALKIIDDVYSNPQVCKCSDYNSQITLANRILSEKYWTDRKSRHIFLALEEIAIRVICHDLEDSDSFLNRLLWNGRLLEALSVNLEGISGCWGKKDSGTFLFWGIDKKGRRFNLKGDFDKKPVTDHLVLSGVDLDGEAHSFTLKRSGLTKALMSHKLLPGLFLTFFSLGIARKTCLIGGCFQGEYLRQMCDGVKRSFETVFDHIDEKARNWLDSFREKSFPYLCGPLYLTGGDAGRYYPLSSVELWSDPPSFSDFKQRLQIRFEKVQQIGLYCFYPDSIPAHLREDQWWEKIGKEIF